MNKKSEGSVAPKERINIKYVPSTGEQHDEVELPLNLLVIGDLKGTTEDASIEERPAVSIDKYNFSSVMKEADIQLDMDVPNRLEDNAKDDLRVRLNFESMIDFTPDRVARQVPELNKLLELRDALVALKGPLGNIPAFRSRLQSLLSDESLRDQLLSELNMATGESK
ncbi:type VI secretion system contractile sheath small subunit [Hafnia alvei]|uniref:type VI secretion system contractile sheath small subunit n=1 Tax=Hafnia alvei TaxID=569 RepID=UPI0014181D3C|nr:type VI secretion system contractile sheath small subunit [Hafnia alvei]MCE9870543.1 type VI secretion system contractile sheath small subunit [Hafnia alvei]NEY26818.1 type VI secretion system contractile sheath small subunit [Escherichia coli]